jgi:hypothetical protein
MRRRIDGRQIPDDVADWLERFLDGRFFSGGCWAVMILAALYFGAGFVLSDLCQGIFTALAR